MNVKTAPTAEASPGPAPLAEAPASESGPGLDHSLDDADSIVAALEAKETADQQAASPAEAQPEETEEPSEAEEPATTAEDEAPPEAAEAAPSSWGKDAQEVFAKLPPEIKAEVVKRETEREAFVNRKAQEAAQSRKEAAALHGYATQELSQVLGMASAAIEGEFSGIDWPALKQQDPALATRLEGMRQERLAAVERAMEHQRILQEAGQRKYLADLDGHLRAEAQNAIGKIGAIVGDGFESGQWKNEAAQYLTGMGAPPEHINGLSHTYQLELVAKAMQYDRMKKDAAAAQAKIADAPKVMAPKGGGAAETGGAQKKAAMDRLRRDPNSLEAVVEALKYT